MSDLTAAEYAALDTEDRAYIDRLRSRRAARENACAVCGQPLRGRDTMLNARSEHVHPECLAPRVPGPDAPGMVGC